MSTRRGSVHVDEKLAIRKASEKWNLAKGQKDPFWAEDAFFSLKFLKSEWSSSCSRWFTNKGGVEAKVYQQDLWDKKWHRMCGASEIKSSSREKNTHAHYLGHSLIVFFKRAHSFVTASNRQTETGRDNGNWIKCSTMYAFSCRALQ